jgi:hypothetical protein
MLDLPPRLECVHLSQTQGRQLPVDPDIESDGHQQIRVLLLLQGSAVPLCSHSSSQIEQHGRQSTANKSRLDCVYRTKESCDTAVALPPNTTVKEAFE